MTEGAKLVTSEPDVPKVPDETADTKRPVALPGVSHEHLNSQKTEETKSDKTDGEKKS
jgi:hypothetical protein